MSSKGRRRSGFVRRAIFGLQGVVVFSSGVHSGVFKQFVAVEHRRFVPFLFVTRAPLALRLVRCSQLSLLRSNKALMLPLRGRTAPHSLRRRIAIR